jgi:hypothetical protein
LGEEKLEAALLLRLALLRPVRLSEEYAEAAAIAIDLL